LGRLYRKVAANVCERVKAEVEDKYAERMQQQTELMLLVIGDRFGSCITRRPQHRLAEADRDIAIVASSVRTNRKLAFS
jgi:D-alanine-D-alanine ligase-like ATP-grasp enzyme